MLAAQRSWDCRTRARLDPVPLDLVPSATPAFGTPLAATIAAVAR